MRIFRGFTRSASTTNSDARSTIEDVMETDFTRQRLSNKAHIFGYNATLCSRCGANIEEALDAPFRCAGQWKTPPNTQRPITLTAALNSAEDHIVARRTASHSGTESSQGP
jgi:hypothetical protein